MLAALRFIDRVARIPVHGTFPRDGTLLTRELARPIAALAHAEEETAFGLLTQVRRRTRMRRPSVVRADEQEAIAVLNSDERLRSLGAGLRTGRSQHPDLIPSARAPATVGHRDQPAVDGRSDAQEELVSGLIAIRSSTASAVVSFRLRISLLRLWIMREWSVHLGRSTSGLQQVQ